MKRILITGKDSYIGTSVEKWLLKTPEKYQVDTLDVKGEEWKNHDFSKYDVVFHVAGIVHIKETKKKRDLYFKINKDLAYEVAKKAKQNGVKQFIFLSTMSVYGLETGIISSDTELRPNTAYGQSKLEAEILIKSLEDQFFKVAILRPPMVYGKGSRGNYANLSKLAKITVIFPNVVNKRSMIFIDNLSNYILYIINQNLNGVFFPQNEKYVCTSAMVNAIAEVNNKKIVFTKIFNPLIKLFNIKIVSKVFGNLVYDMKISEYPIDFMFTSFYDSIKKSEMDEV